MKNTKKLLTLSLSVLTALSLAACSTSSTSENSKTSGGTSATSNTSQQTTNSTKETYELLFMSNYGTPVYESTELEEGATITLPDSSSLLEIEGYEFAGWYSDYACTKEFDLTKMPGNDLTAFAKYVHVFTNISDSSKQTTIGASKTLYYQFDAICENYFEVFMYGTEKDTSDYVKKITLYSDVDLKTEVANTSNFEFLNDGDYLSSKNKLSKGTYYVVIETHYDGQATIFFDGGLYHQFSNDGKCAECNAVSPNREEVDGRGTIDVTVPANSTYYVIVKATSKGTAYPFSLTVSTSETDEKVKDILLDGYDSNGTHQIRANVGNMISSPMTGSTKINSGDNGAFYITLQNKADTAYTVTLSVSFC